jgi:hypothetical protein
MELNVQGVNDVRQTEIRTVEPLVLFCTFEVDVTVGKLSRCKSPGIDQIPAELIRAVWNILRSEIHKLIFVWNTEKLPQQWKESVIVPDAAFDFHGDEVTCRGLLIYDTMF